MRTTDRKSLLAFHRIEDRLARVFLRPHPRQTTRPYQARIQSGEQATGHAPLDSSVKSSMTPEEIILTIRHAGIVRIGGGAETKLVRIETLGVLQRQTILQALPCIAADHMRDAAFWIAEEIRQDFEAREFVVG